MMSQNNPDLAAVESPFTYCGWYTRRPIKRRDQLRTDADVVRVYHRHTGLRRGTLHDSNYSTYVPGERGLDWTMWMCPETEMRRDRD